MNQKAQRMTPQVHNKSGTTTSVRYDEASHVVLIRLDGLATRVARQSRPTPPARSQS
jgi:YD repeat-containing protein